MSDIIISIETKEKVWEEYGKKEFKHDFPIASNRTAIYQKVENGISLNDTIDEILKELSMHENAQRNKKKKFIHTIGPR